MSPRLPILLLLAASIAAYAIDKDDAKFRPPAAAEMDDKLAISGVTIGADAYDQEAQAKTAFGKLHPYEYGVLPVLVVIQNDTKQTISLADMKVEYVAPDRSRVEATPAADVPYLKPPKRPSFAGQYPIPLPKKKSPLLNPVIGERAFAAKMIPPGDSAHGFFYFQSGHRSGSQLYITGLKEAQSGKELFFFEIPLR